MMSAVRLNLLLGCLCLLQACVSASSSRPPSDEDAARANISLGAGYLQRGNPELAIERLERALTQDPRSLDAHSLIAIAYDQTGDLDEAEQHYRRAIQLAPDSAAAANSYAVFLCRQSRWPDAEPYFRRAADNRGYATPEVALTNAGVCALNSGDRADAEQYLRAALERNPTYPDALVSMMQIAFDNGNALQARAFLQRSLEARPADASLLWMCFRIERALENQEAADRCASQLETRFPGSAEFAQLTQLRRDARE